MDEGIDRPCNRSFETAIHVLGATVSPPQMKPYSSTSTRVRNVFHGRRSLEASPNEPGDPGAPFATLVIDALFPFSDSSNDTLSLYNFSPFLTKTYPFLNSSLTLLRNRLSSLPLSLHIPLLQIRSCHIHVRGGRTC